MPYTAAQLTSYYTALTGAPIDASTSVLLQAYAQQNSAGTLSDAQTLAAVFNSQGVQATFEVAESTYQFFTGSLTSAPGQTYLEGSNAAGSPNTNGLNSTYYSQFNTENRYYNFAVNLATTGGAGASAFASAYGNISIAPTGTSNGLSPFIQAAYETIVGSANVGTAAANAAITDIYSRLSYFTAVAQQRAGGVDAGGAAGQNIALKAVIVGYILEEANKADVGTYAKALDQFEASIAAGNGLYSTSLTASYSPGGAGFNTGVGTTTSNTGGVNGGGAGVNLTPNVETVTGTSFNGGLFFNAPSGTYLQTLNTGDVLNGTGTSATLNVTTQSNTAAGATVVPTLNNIPTINVINLTPGAIGPETIDLSSTTNQVKTINVQQSTGPLNIINNAGALTALSVGNTGGFLTTVTSTGTVLNGTSDTLALTSNASAGGNNAVSIAGYEIVNFNAVAATGASATTNTTAITDGNLTTLNITGGAGVNVSFVGSGFLTGANTTVTTINAGGVAASGTTTASPALTGSLTIGSLGSGTTFNSGNNTIGQTTAAGGAVTAITAPTGLGNSVLTYIGSTGVDSLVLATGLTAADNINGNGGADVLSIVAGDNPTAALNLTNVPTVQFYTTPTQFADGGANTPGSVFAAATTINRAFFGATSATTLNLGSNQSETQTSAAAITVTNLQSGNTIGYDFAPGVVTLNATGVVTGVTNNNPGNLTTTLATDTAADTVNLTFRDTDVVSTFGSTGTMTQLTATGVETLNITTTGGTGVVNPTATLNVAQQNTDTLAITQISDTALTSMTIKATTNLALNSTGAFVLNNLAQIDASASTGNISLGAINAAGTPGTAIGTQFTTVNTGANISTGSGNDLIVLDTGATGIVKNIVMGGDYFGASALTPGATAAGAAATTVQPVFLNDFGNFLALQSTTSTTTGVTQIDLSSTTDQITQVQGATNIAAGQVQTGIDSIDVSFLSNATNTNTATIIGNANANFIVGTSGADTISSGAGNDVVQGGGGADNINVGTGTDTIRFVALGDSTVGATGVVADATVLTGADIVTGIVKGDRADFSLDNVTTGVVPAAATLEGGTFIPVGTATLAGVAYNPGTNAAGTAGAESLVRGTYNAAANTFTAAAAGNDYLYQHDTNGAAAGGLVDVVLVGAAAAGITQVISSGNGYHTFG